MREQGQLRAEFKNLLFLAEAEYPQHSVGVFLDAVHPRYLESRLANQTLSADVVSHNRFSIVTCAEESVDVELAENALGEARLNVLLSFLSQLRDLEALNLAWKLEWLRPQRHCKLLHFRCGIALRSHRIIVL